MSRARTVVVATIAAAAVVAGAVVVGVRINRSGADQSARLRGCTPTVDATRSVARDWDEAALDAIRRDFPAPTVHARNLFHLSAVLWDGWATYHPGSRGYFVDEKRSSAHRQAAAQEAMSFAAYGLLRHRYEHAVNAKPSLARFDDLMAALCYDTHTTPHAGSPAAVGRHIAEVAIEAGRHDGSLEDSLYVDAAFTPKNEPMPVAQPGTKMADPNRWQPLKMETLITQNGLQQPSNVQTFLGSSWGSVTSFALPKAVDGVAVDPGAPPRLDDPATAAAFKQEAIDVLRASAQLGPNDDTTIDISPGATGDDPLGTNDGHGRATNPVTGQPYVANVVNRSDFARVLAEYWADGPKSETPPGHWHVIANEVSDKLAPAGLRFGGAGRPLDRLEWDVKLYFALSAADHDAAIAAWGLKGRYQSARPISMIRYLGGLGQSSDPSLPAYNADGLPLVPGLVEVITKETTAPGARHAALAGHEGEIAVYAWRGQPADITTQVGGVGWIRAVDWTTYQRKTFVTPAFPGYVSGHSTFSRAAATVLTAITGSEYFPGGLGSKTLPAGFLHFEKGPSKDVTLQWATYYDAADQAGISRIFGGIHPSIDDLTGRRLGSTCGTAAWAKALTYFGSPRN